MESNAAGMSVTVEGGTASDIERVVGMAGSELLSALIKFVRINFCWQEENHDKSIKDAVVQTRFLSHSYRNVVSLRIYTKASNAPHGLTYTH